MPSLNKDYKTSHYLPQVRTCDFEGISPLWPPLPGRVIRLSFSTSPKTLSLRFDSVQVYREAELSASTGTVKPVWFLKLKWERNSPVAIFSGCHCIMATPREFMKCHQGVQCTMLHCKYNKELQCKYAKATAAFHGWVTTRENTDWEKRIHHDSVHAKTFQSCLTLCGPMDCSPPGSSVHGILQARILECIITLSPGDLPDPGMEPLSLISPALADRVFFYC